MNIGMILDNEFTGDMRVENEVIALRQAGFNVEVLCFTFGEKARVEDFHGARITRLPVSKFLVKKTKPFINTPLDPYSYFWAQRIKRFIRRARIDVLHVNDLFLLPGALRARRGVSPGFPIVADLHENYPAALKNYKFATTFPGNLIVSIPRWERSEVRWLREADYAITVIEEALERYVSLGVPANKLTVVANYVNEGEFLSEATKSVAPVDYPGRFVLTYIGGFDIHRGLEEVVRALPAVAASIPEVLLLLVGSGSNKTDLEELARELDVADKIIFAGWQPPSSLPGFIAASDVCLIPHVKTEHTDNTIPHKLFHYMLLKKPVLASNCAPIVRILEESGAGVHYPSGDSGAFAERVIDLYRQPEQRQEMGEKGYSAVTTKYNWGEAAKELVGLYRQVEADLAPA